MKRDFVSVGYGNGKEEILKRGMPGTEVKDVCGMWYGYGYGYLAAAYHFPNDTEVQSNKCPKMGTKGLAAKF